MQKSHKFPYLSAVKSVELYRARELIAKLDSMPRPEDLKELFNGIRPSAPLGDGPS